VKIFKKHQTFEAIE